MKINTKKLAKIIASLPPASDWHQNYYQVAILSEPAVTTELYPTNDYGEHILTFRKNVYENDWELEIRN